MPVPPSRSRVWSFQNTASALQNREKRHDGSSHETSKNVRTQGNRSQVRTMSALLLQLDSTTSWSASLKAAGAAKLGDWSNKEI